MGKKRRKLVADGAVDKTMVIVTAGSVLSERYKLVEELGRGGMGIVFAAEDLELDGKRVAVKVLPPEMSTSKAAIKRLKKEAIAAMELTHENVMRLYSFETDGQTAYLVLEYIDGEPLDERLADIEQFTYEETLEVARGAVAGLSAAHRQGIIHRDIKPANLMYKTIGDEKVIRITDFGIAYIVKDSMTRLTGTESAGTLSYIAPEQLKGERANAKTDQYSLGATIYELLSGDPPFVGGGLSHQILHAEAKEIEGIPDHANAALLKALAKDPQERFDDLNEFFAAFAGDEPVVAAAPAETVEELEEAEEVPAEVATEPVALPPPAPGMSGTKKALIGLVGLGLLVCLAGAAHFKFRKFSSRRYYRVTKSADKKAPATPVPTHNNLIKATKTTKAAPLVIAAFHSSPKGLKVFSSSAFLGYTPFRTNVNPGLIEVTYVVSAKEKIKRRYSVSAGGNNEFFFDLAKHSLKKAKRLDGKGDYTKAFSTLQKAAHSCDDSQLWQTFTEYAKSHKTESAAHNWLPKRQVKADDLAFLERAAQQEVPEAHNALGKAYERGRGVKQDTSKAVQYYRQAAKLGSAEAEYNLGRVYENGKGVPQSKSEALQWYKKALANGETKARKKIALLSDQMSTRKKVGSTPIQNWLKEAREGNINAQYALGSAYLNGKGVAQNKREAIRWFRLAARNGHPQALRVLRRLSRPNRRPMVKGGPPAPPRNLR